MQLDSWSTNHKGFMYYKGRLVIVDSPEALMMEAHRDKFAILLRSTKMYQDMKCQYWWKGTKRYVTSFLTKCMIYQQVKVEPQRPSGLLQPLEILE